MIKNVIAMITPQAGRIMAKARRPRLRHRSMKGCTISQNSGMVQYPDATTSARISTAARRPMDNNLLHEAFRELFNVCVTPFSAVDVYRTFSPFGVQGGAPLQRCSERQGRNRL